MEDEFFYLREEFDVNKQKKAAIVSIVNRHSSDEDQVSMALTKPELVETFESRIWVQRDKLLRAAKRVSPSKSNIEDASTNIEAVPTRSRGRIGKPAPSAKPVSLGKVHLSPEISGPRTRSRSRSPAREVKSPRRKLRTQDLQDVLKEEAEPPEELQKILKSPRKAKTTTTKKATKAKKEEPVKEEVRHLIKEEEDASNFSSDNLFQAPSSSDFKRKRDENDTGADLRPARRREIAPHKHKQAAAPQSLPENAADVFSHPPDLQAPANLSHEPFDVSYGEPGEEILEQVLNLPDASEIAEIAVTSTPDQVPRWLPSLNHIQDKVNSVIETADKFIKVVDGDMTGTPTLDPQESEEEKSEPSPKQVTKRRSNRLAENAVLEDTSVVESDEEEKPQEEEDKLKWYQRIKLPQVNVPTIPKPDIPKVRIPKVNLPTIAWKSVVISLFKYFCFFIGTVVTLSILGISAWGLLWMRREKLHLGYCNAGPDMPVNYPEIFEWPVESELVADAQNWLFNRFEELTPECTPCPDNAKCTLYEAQCQETFVKDWPFFSYLGFPLPPRCVTDPVKQYKLNELKKRAATLLNNKRADVLCNGAENAEVEDSNLKAELYAKKAQGVSDELFDELYEKIRLDFEAGDINFPDITVTRQVIPPILEHEELTLAPDAEPYKEKIYFVSNSLVNVGWWCQSKLTLNVWVQDHQDQLQKIFCGAFVAVVLVVLVRFFILRHRRTKAQYELILQVLQQLREDADNDPTGQSQAWSAAHLLLAQISSKREREQIERQIKNNPNVRARHVESAGEMVRTWEWVPT